jgi:hypothetical protein
MPAGQVVGFAVSELRRTATLAKDATALAFGKTAPDAVLLAHREGVLQADLAHRALRADRLRAARVLVLRRVEDLGVDATTCGELPPATSYGKSLECHHLRPLQVRNVLTAFFRRVFRPT